MESAEVVQNTFRQPLLWYDHGSPMNALNQTPLTQAWKKMIEDLPVPKGILCVSAHWETGAHVAVTTNKVQKTIHDFSSRWPKELFDTEYPSPGSPELVARVAALIPGVELSGEWGLDHGSWSILNQIYPKADVPVVELSLNTAFSFQEHADLAKKLDVLRDEGYLLIFSGNIVHQEKELGYDIAGKTREFLDAMLAALEKGDTAAVVAAKSHPGYEAAASTDEHFVPLLYIAALRRPSDKFHLYNGTTSAAFSYVCFRYE